MDPIEYALEAMKGNQGVVVYCMASATAGALRKQVEPQLRSRIIAHEDKLRGHRFDAVFMDEFVNVEDMRGTYLETLASRTSLTEEEAAKAKTILFVIGKRITS